jgi:hypothetical protein
MSKIESCRSVHPLSEQKSVKTVSNMSSEWMPLLKAFYPKALKALRLPTDATQVAGPTPQQSRKQAKTHWTVRTT